MKCIYNGRVTPHKGGFLAIEAVMSYMRLQPNGLYKRMG